MNRPNRASRNQAMRWSCSAAASAACATKGATVRDRAVRRSEAFISFERFITGAMLDQLMPQPYMAESAASAKPECQKRWRPPILSQAMSERGNGPKLMDGWRDWRREI